MGMGLFKYSFRRLQQVIVHWELCSNMRADDVKRTVDTAIQKAKLINKQKPKLLSDSGSCYIASELNLFKIQLSNAASAWQTQSSTNTRKN